MENNINSEVEYYCTDCKAIVNQGDTICMVCGANLSLEIQQEVPESEIASHGKRLLNFLLDGLFLFVIYILIVNIFFVVLGMTGVLTADLATTLPGFFTLLVFVLYIITFLSYYILLEHFFSRTIAKHITKTIVVSEIGSKPALNAIILRSLSRLVPFDNLSFLNSKAVGWHDRWTKTRVVNY